MFRKGSGKWLSGGEVQKLDEEESTMVTKMIGLWMIRWVFYSIYYVLIIENFST